MSRAEAPRIDPRSYSDLVAEVETLIQCYTGNRWQPGQHDAGQALVRIFGRMAELVVNRLNRLPERNFLAFLDLIGTRLNPPQPARVPLTFLLAAGSPVDALVPAGTQAVATALEGEAEPPLFATERDLVVTRSQLVAVHSREPGRDLWADHTAIATGRTPGTFQPFRGNRPIVRALSLDHPLLGMPETKTVELRIGLPDTSPPWPSEVSWSFWNGAAWQALKLESSQGMVRLAAASGFAASQVNGLDGHWLRGELETTDNGSDWSRLWINSLSVAITIDRRQARMMPERSFANQAPLDLSKDVLPFGEKPKIGDTLYLANDEAFSKSGAGVELHIALTNPSDPAATPRPAASSNVMLAWEFWDGREWQILGNTGTGATDQDRQKNSEHRFEDTTNGFLHASTGEGIIRFTVPQDLTATEINGEVRHWIRVWIARGSYGAEASYEPVTVDGVSQYRLVPATFRPPSLSSLRLSYFYRSGEKNQAPQRVLIENDFTFADVTQTLAAAERGFKPFILSADPRPTLYLGFERPGDTAGFGNRSAALFFQMSETLYNPKIEQGMVTEDAAVVWEYWNGAGWERLGTDDETRGLTRRGLLSFIGPPDFKASADFGRTAFWLRGRWKRGEYASEPGLTRILTNTMWALHAETILGETLGSGRGEPRQVFRTLRTPVLAGQVLEVIEPEIPSEADLAELKTEEGDDAVTIVRDPAGQLVEVRVRWHEVPDFHGSGPRSRHYVLDPLSGEVRFGDGRCGLVPPPGRNNVRMALYRAGGGLAGNRPAGNIARLNGTVPYVAGVLQTGPANGGAAEESLEAVRLRGPKALRHGGRAVVAADFEDLAFQASPQVARAQALPASRGGAHEGRVVLIVVPASESAQPIPGLELLTRVRSYLEARLSPVVDFRVTGPDWLQIKIRAEIVPLRIDAAIDVQNAVHERLGVFLHPLSGGPTGDGWELGRKPHRSDLYALIEETPGVDHVRWLEVIETPGEGGARPGRFQVFSGNHDIAVRGNVDSAANPGSPV